MIEFLFLVAFAFVLLFTGVSLVGMAVAVFAGFVVMALVGMLGIVLKLLPWLILIAVGIWLYRRHQPAQCRQTHDRRTQYRRRY
ncbi:envelope stress response protein PspG [Photobacterium atrarenae]|uniref:Envelope stress response protein PspG n=1 Tax=Photobacterium atrarenae TaxID=865757 RepID=A0ABY5GF86_9GAMM|nr:envelope stress response protein PspG [Photobacterium atrarenae]UTV27490.1 envelope stress response protein PspG [Photobacterium atrarenae]